MPVQDFVARLAVTALIAGASSHAIAENAQSNDGAAARADAVACPENGEAISGCCRQLPDDPRRHPADGNRPRSERGDCELSAQRPDNNREQRLLSKPRNQWAHLLHLSSAAGRVVAQCPARARAVFGGSGRTTVPPGRRRHLPFGRRLDIREKANGLPPAAGERIDPGRAANAVGWSGVPNPRCERSLWLQHAPAYRTEEFNDRHSIGLPPPAAGGES